MSLYIPLKIRAIREGILQQEISIYCFERSEQGSKVAQPLEFRFEDEGVSFLPIVRLSPDEAQSLMDDLWECGLRPSEGTGSVGAMAPQFELAATQRHLEDMRKLVFDYLNKMMSHSNGLYHREEL